MFSDLFYAMRALLSRPLFTAIAAASLALGIGANTAIFSVVDSALVHRLPNKDSDELLQIRDNQPCCNYASIAPGEFLDYQRQTKTLSGLAAFTTQELTLTGRGEPAKFRAAAVTPNFFEVLGAQAERGRLLSSALDRPQQQRAAVISDGLWRGVFASDPNIVGSNVDFNGNSFHIVGVLRPDQSYPANAQVWVSPRYVVPEYVEDVRGKDFNIAASYGNHYLEGLGRMKPGVTPAQTRAELRVIASRIAAAHPEQKDHYGVLWPLHDRLVSHVKPALWILLGAVVLLLLIACANMTGLLLARFAGRTRELAVRSALGAGRARLVRLLLSESLLVAFAGGLAGVALATQGMRLMAHMSTFDLPASMIPEINWHVLLFCLLTTLLSALLSGLAPALRASQLDLQDGLKEGTKASGSTAAIRLRRFLVAAEIALSVVLLTGACLLIHSFKNLLDVNPGFDAANVTTARIGLPLGRYSHASANVFWSNLVERVLALPDVESAAVISYLPMSGAESGSDLTLAGASKSIYADTVAASPQFFQALHVPLLSGTAFSGREVESGPPVVIVNRAFEEKNFPHGSAIGKRFTGGMADGETTIIGVAGNVKNNGLDETTPLLVYYNVPQYGVDSASLVVRARERNADIPAELRKVLHGLDPSLALSDVKPIADYVGGSLATRRFLLGLLSAFAALAVGLSALGVYGVLSYSVEQRRREIGIRLALGAERGEVLQLLLVECGLMAMAGLGAGMMASFWTTSFLKGMLFGISALDFAAYVVSLLLVLGFVVAASAAPALRAAAIDPVIALRYE